MAVINIGLSPELTYCPNHTHDMWEIIINQQGEGHMDINGTYCKYKPGTVICLPPGAGHIKYGVKYRDIFIQASSFSLINSNNEVLIFQDDAEKKIEALALMAIHVYNRMENNYKAVVNSLYEAICQILFSLYDIKYRNPAVEKTKNRIIESFTDPELKLSKVLESQEYSSDHIRRLFKKETGLTLQSYLTNLRLNHAEKLLKSNRFLHYSISEISMMAGYYDCGYFSKAFKKKTGVSPTEFMNQ
ncbi:MAG: AraC family transcriptional regulator [Synergistaceae bacterium]|nr:AraC family transcriptional regulator [Synergistaceae bacterium]